MTPSDHCSHDSSHPCAWPGCPAGVAGRVRAVVGPREIVYLARERAIEVAPAPAWMGEEMAREWRQRIGVVVWRWVEVRRVRLGAGRVA